MKKEALANKESSIQDLASGPSIWGKKMYWLWNEQIELLILRGSLMYFCTKIGGKIQAMWKEVLRWWRAQD